MKTNTPGFAAEASLYATNHTYHRAEQAMSFKRNQAVAPQFSVRAFVCGALAVAILAGQVELAEVAATYCIGSA